MIEVTERFDGLAEAYDRHRPDYPPGLFEGVVARAPAAPAHAADLAAGTGISTARLLAALPAGWRLTAIEPGRDMRGVLSRRFAGEDRVAILDARAEATGLADGALALLTACTAFHWFDWPAFFPEARRVLAPGGVLAVIRNAREPMPVIDAFDAFFRAEATEDLDEVRKGHHGQREALSAAEGFGALEEVSVAWSRPMDRAALVAMYLTRSTSRTVVEKLGRAAVEARLAAIWDATVAGEAVDLGYRATALSVRRL